MPALVDQETFDRAQSRLATDGGRRGPANGVWLEADLRGLLFCKCGLGMIARHHRDVNTTRRYYKCMTRHSHDYPSGDCTGESSYVRMEPVDDAVRRALLAEMDDGDGLQRKFLEYHSQLEHRHTADQQSTRQIRSELDTLGKQEAEAWGIYDSGEAGWDSDQLKRRLAQITEKREALQRRLKEIESAERTANQIQQAAIAIKPLAEQYRDRLRNLPKEQRGELPRLLVKRVTLHADNSLTIEWRFPQSDPATIPTDNESGHKAVRSSNEQVNKQRCGDGIEARSSEPAPQQECTRSIPQARAIGGNLLRMTSAILNRELFLSERVVDFH